MNYMNLNIIQKIKDGFKVFVSKKRYWIGAIIVILIAVPLIMKDNAANIVTSKVENKTLIQTVLATGQVTSITDLSLSFDSSGVIKNIPVVVGQKVKKGQILASLEQGNELAVLTQARGQLLAARAKYQKILEGATNEEVAIAKTALTNAETDLEKTKNAQATLVENARRTMINAGLEMYPDNTSNTLTTPTLSGTYTGEVGTYIITPFSSGSGGYFSFNGIETGTGIISTATFNPLGTKGLFIKFPSNFNSGLSTSWTLDIPNKKSASYIAAVNTYNSALETQKSQISSAESQVATRQAEFNLKVAKARDADISLSQADVLSAEGNLQNAQANFEKTVIRSPGDGTITKVVNKVGELSQAQKESIVLQDIDNLYIKANINESNITTVSLGQKVSITFDAFPGNYTGEVVHIDPAAKIEDGIVNYEIKISINEKDMFIRPGMNADIKIDANEKPNTIVAPKASIKKDEKGSYVEVVINPKNKKSERRNVTTGVTGDGALVEIISGLSVGEEIIVSRI